MSIGNVNPQQYYVNTASNPLAAFGYHSASTNITGFGNWTSMGLGGIFDDVMSLSSLADSAAAYSATQGSIAKQYEAQNMAQGFAKAQWQAQERDQLMSMGASRATIDAVIKAGGIQAAQASGLLNNLTASNATPTNNLISQITQLIGGGTANNTNSSNDILAQLAQLLGGGAGATTPAANTASVETVIQQLLSNPNPTEADFAQAAELLTNSGMSMEQIDQILAGGTATTTTDNSTDELTQLLQSLGLGGVAAPTTNTSSNPLSSILSLFGLGGATAPTTNTSSNPLSSILSLFGLGGTTQKATAYVPAPSYSDEDGGDAAFWANLLGTSSSSTQTQSDNSELAQLLSLLS